MDQGFHKPLVTAVITTHNRKQLVLKALYSVMQQTYTNIEIIVIDDASEDGSRVLLSNKASEMGFTYYYITKKESKGGNYARNKGILMSHGKYVAFLDDDDEWMPEKTDLQTAFMESHPECGVVSCDRIDEINYETRKYYRKKNMFEGDVHDIVYSDICFVTSTAMYRKDKLIEIGMFDEELRYWQETELNFRMAQVSEFGCIHDYLVLYRVLDSDKNRLTNHLNGWIEAIDYIEEKHKENIEKLPRDLYIKHRLLIAKDGAYRASKVGNRCMEKKYMKEVCAYQPTIVNWIIKSIGWNTIHQIIMLMRKLKLRIVQRTKGE